MSYFDYKQQYTYGFGPIDFSQLTFATYETKFYLGEAVGAKANLSKTSNESTYTKPLDHKALKQMFHKKALLDFLCLESFAPLGRAQTVKLTISSTAGSAGKHTITIKDETPVEVDIANSTTAAAAAAAIASALAGLKNWNVAYTASNAYVELTRKEASANWTYSDTTKFKFETTVTTQTGAWSQPDNKTGIAVEADTTHVFRFDLKSVDNDTDLDAYIAGTLTLDPIVSIYIKGNQALPCATPAFESLMPSNVGLKSWFEVSMPNISSTSTTMTSGKMVVGYDKN